MADLPEVAGRAVYILDFSFAPELLQAIVHQRYKLRRAIVITSNRIVCTDYFKGKVDGWLSLSGGRIGQAPFVAQFGPPKADGSPPDARPRGAMPASSVPACDFSHIFEVGQWEIESLPATSPWAEKYGCGARVREKDIVDDKPGHVWDFARAGYKVWGMEARPGVSEGLVSTVKMLGSGWSKLIEPITMKFLVSYFSGTRLPCQATTLKGVAGCSLCHRRPPNFLTIS